jgi:hypothetical protein
MPSPLTIELDIGYIGFIMPLFKVEATYQDI